MVGSILGTTVRRVEDPELLVGASTYVDDLRSAGTAARRLRAQPRRARPDHHGRHRPRPQPRPACARCSPARTSAPHRCRRSGSSDTTSSTARRWPTDRVRYVGDPVALVVAETRAQAVDAAELVDVDYDLLDGGHRHGGGARRRARPLQFPELGCNVAGSRKDDDPSDPWPAGADVVVRVRIENQRIAGRPHRGQRDPGRPPADGDAAPAYSRPSTRTWRATCSRGSPGYQADRVRVVTPHVGGAFGGKAGSRGHTARSSPPPRRSAGRSPGPRPAARRCSRCTAAARCSTPSSAWTDDGRILGMRLRHVGDCGAYAGFGGGNVLGGTLPDDPGRLPRSRRSTTRRSRRSPTPHRWARSAAPAGPRRRPCSSGCSTSPPTSSTSPEEIRRRNLIASDDFPYETVTGARYDVGDFELALREALRVADVDRPRRADPAA